jgi:hypothetical protein
MNRFEYRSDTKDDIGAFFALVRFFFALWTLVFWVFVFH